MKGPQKKTLVLTSPVDGTASMSRKHQKQGSLSVRIAGKTALKPFGGEELPHPVEEEPHVLHRPLSHLEGEGETERVEVEVTLLQLRAPRVLVGPPVPPLDPEQSHESPAPEVDGHPFLTQS